MAIVVICLGQCGNQLALSFFDTMIKETTACGASSEWTERSLSAFFRHPAGGFRATAAAQKVSATKLPTAPEHSIQQSVTKLDAVLGLASRIRSKSAPRVPRPSPYAASSTPSAPKRAGSIKLHPATVVSKQPLERGPAARSRSRGAASRIPRPDAKAPPPATVPPEALPAHPSIVAATLTSSEPATLTAVPFVSLVARAVLVDMEPKVNQRLLPAP